MSRSSKPTPPETVYYAVRVRPEGEKSWRFYEVAISRLYGRVNDVTSFKRARPDCTYKVWKATVTWEEVE